MSRMYEEKYEKIKDFIIPEEEKPFSLVQTEECYMQGYKYYFP